MSSPSSSIALAIGPALLVAGAIYGFGWLVGGLAAWVQDRIDRRQK